MAVVSTKSLASSVSSLGFGDWLVKDTITDRLRAANGDIILSDFNDFYVPKNATIVGIEVGFVGYSSSTNTSNNPNVYVSSDGGSTWSSAKNVDSNWAAASANVYRYAGGSADLWGESFTHQDFTAAGDFQVKVNIVGITMCFWDYVEVRVHYTDATATMNDSYRYDKNSYGGGKPNHRQVTDVYNYKITKTGLASLESEVGKTFTDLRDVYNTLRGMEKSNNSWFITNSQGGSPTVTFGHKVKDGATSIEKKRESGNLQGRKRLR